MPVFVSRAIAGDIPLEIPFVSDVYQYEKDSYLGPFMSIVSVEKYLRSSQQHADSFSSEDLLVFFKEGSTDPVMDKVSDAAFLSFVVQKARPDYHLKILFDTLQNKAEHEFNDALLNLRRSIVRLPDAEMPDGWSYSIQ